MALELHCHPLSSSCWKVLIALYEHGIAFTPRLVNLGDPANRAAFVALWPTGKMPLLVDGGVPVPETTIIIEHLALHHGARALVPQDAAAGLEARLMDRLLDLYVMVPMQAIVGDRLRPEADRDPTGVAKARATLAMAYGLLEQRLQGRTWAAGEGFTIADCTAAPALFYATTLVPLAPEHAQLRAYLQRLLAHPPVARVLEEARPFFAYYPYKDALPEGFRPAG